MLSSVTHKTVSRSHFMKKDSISRLLIACRQNYSGTGGGGGGEAGKKGCVVDRAPVKLKVEEGKLYSWCACGLSQKQPWCDGAHKRENSELKPVRFTAPATKEYYFCNCKQTSRAPFCDGTHKKL